MVKLLSEKEEKYMDKYKATIERKDSNTALHLNLSTSLLTIALTEDKPLEVKTVFNKLLMELKKGEFEFELVDEKEDLYYHICKEYIKQLNVELKSIYKELLDRNLVAN